MLVCWSSKIGNVCKKNNFRVSNSFQLNPKPVPDVCDGVTGQREEG